MWGLMKQGKIILEFRRAFCKLEYRKNRMTVEDLKQWIITWCAENRISRYYYAHFEMLAFAYAEKEYQEVYLSRVDLSE